LVLYDKIPVEKNFISGYRYMPGKIRYKRIFNGKVLFDNTFQVNNMGFISNVDFKHSKTSDTYRFIVLGDSFTSGEYISESWPSKLNYEFNSDSINYEFYSFALGGGGFLNSYNQFFYEVIPNYNFDAVILAIFGDDIKRDMIYADCVNGEVFYYRSTEIIKQIEDFERIEFNRNIGAVLSDFDSEKNLLDLGALQRPYPIMSYVLNSLFMRELNQKRLAYYKEIAVVNNTNSETVYCSNDFIKRYGLAKYNYFIDMVNYCDENSKPMILVSIPGKELVEWYKEEPLVINQELEFLSDTFNLYYFDTYPQFAKLSEESLDSLFIYYDGHWNQKGSDYFSEIFSTYLHDNIFLIKSKSLLD
jgi:hypothetical protein